MGDPALQFAALVGSRICHDLISPIGAINNGMELLSMSGTDMTPELTLISESVEAANARIRFFRIAYGAPNDAQIIGRTEVVSILRDVSRGASVQPHWEPVEDLNRSEVQLGFLALQCAEQAMPYGGEITLSRLDGRWVLKLASDRVTLDPDLQAHLTQPREADDLGLLPAHIQFVLLPMHAAARGRDIRFELFDGGALLTV